MDGRPAGRPYNRSRLPSALHRLRPLLLVGPVADAVLVELAAALEAVEAEATVEIVLVVVGDGVGEAPAGGRRRLEALIAPAAVEIEVRDARLADEGAAVGRHVLDAAPVAQQPQARDAGHQRHRALGDE